MKINEITDSAQNVKAESGMKELQSVAETISDPENWAVSMTGEPKLGINPQVGISEDTPKGIYFYPLDYAVDIARRGKKLPWGDNMPYIQLFQYDRSGEMTQQTQVDPTKLKQALRKYCPDEIIQQAAEENEYDGTPYWFIYDCLSRLGKGDETNVIRWNKVLRDLGFTSVFDDGAGWIAHNEPTQGVVLDPRIIKQLKTILNKKKSGVVTPAVIEQDIFNTLDIELASERAWQAYDPDGSKLKAAAKEYAKDPKFKPWFGKPGSEEIFNKAASLGRFGARQLRQEARDWYKEQQAQQPVTEAFDQPYRLKWEKSDYSSDVDALAKMDDGGYLSIMFNKGYNQATKEEAWSVEFYRNNSQEVTGEGDQQRVFATVLSAIQQFIKKYKPNNVIFAASKQVEAGQNSASRARLYDRLVQRYATSWGFRMTRDDTGNKVIYDLSRIKPIVAKAVAEGFQVNEGLGDWITKKIDDYLGPSSVSSDDISRHMKAAPLNLPDDVAKQLTDAFLKKAETQRLLQQAAEAQKTTVQKIVPYLTYVARMFVSRWKQIPQADRQDALRNLAHNLKRFLLFVLETLAKSMVKKEDVAEELEEGWKDWVAGGAMALGAMGAQANTIVSQVVNPGDTVYSIARQNGISPQLLYKINGFNNSTKLTPGQEIKVPDVYTKDAKPTAKAPVAAPAIAQGIQRSHPKLAVKAQPKPGKVTPITGTKAEQLLMNTAIRSGITGTELAAFMAQMAHESHDFRTMVEYGGSLDFRKYDPKYAPRKAKTLGNTKAGDGAKYKGRGFIQITGRYNYGIAGKAVGVDLVSNPKLAASPEIAAKIAVWYWKLRVQPNVDNFNDVNAVTKPINPGMRGLEDRKENFAEYMASLDTTEPKV